MQVERRGRWSPEPTMVVEKLDLFNFDSAAAWDSPVVLSSPRSLAACRRAGVKPVELLYRSEQEVLAALPPDTLDVSAGMLHAVHRRAEDERQAKLHACRAIRHQLMQRQVQSAGSPRHDAQVSSSSDLFLGAKRERSVVFGPDMAGVHPHRDPVRDRSAALVGPLFPAKKDVLRAASPESKRSVAYGQKKGVSRENSPDYRKDNVSTSSPRFRKDISYSSGSDLFRATSPVTRRDVCDYKKDVLKEISQNTLFIGSSPEVKGGAPIQPPETKKRDFMPSPSEARTDPKDNKDTKTPKMITFSASRKDLLDRENTARAESLSRLDSRQDPRLEPRLESKPGSRLDPRSCGPVHAISPNLSAATSPARSVRSARSTPGSEDRMRGTPRTVLVDCWGHSKLDAKPAAGPPGPRRRPPRPSSSGTPSSLSESQSRCSSRRSRRRASRQARPAGSRLGARRSLLRGLRSAAASSASTASCLSPRKAHSAHSVAVVVQDCDSGRGSSTFHSCENALQSLRLASRLGTATPSDLGSWLAGSVLGLGLGDEVHLPEHDRRILESMAMKKQQERRDEDVAHRAHQLWEQEREQRRHLEAERAAKWQAGVNARRQWEAKESARRMEAVKRSLRLAQQRLEENIRLKEQRVQLRVLEEDVQRMVLQGERSKEYAARRLEVEEKLLHIQEGERGYRRLLDEELRARQAQAERRRVCATERERLRAASANREWERCRSERANLLALQTEKSVRVLRASARERHQRAAINKGRIRRRRQQRALQASLEREAKHSDARAMHADLEHGLQLWRERCAALQENAALEAQERAREHREHARAKLHRSNQRRRRHHRVLHARVVAEEEGRRRAQRMEIRDKDQRIRQLRRLKERALEESREQAFATASLREELRRALSPETFDRKAARVQLEMRVSSGRACTSSLSPVPTNRSHIHLG